jgi:DNA-binding transcriptional regulator YiaG
MTPAEVTAAREALGLSRAQLAPLVGRKVRNVQQWERGDRTIDPAAVRLLRAYMEGYRPQDWPKMEE